MRKRLKVIDKNIFSVKFIYLLLSLTEITEN